MDGSQVEIVTEVIKTWQTDGIVCLSACLFAGIFQLLDRSCRFEGVAVCGCRIEMKLRVEGVDRSALKLAEGVRRRGRAEEEGHEKRTPDPNREPLFLSFSPSPSLGAEIAFTSYDACINIWVCRLCDVCAAHSLVSRGSARKGYHPRLP